MNNNIDEQLSRIIKEMRERTKKYIGINNDYINWLEKYTEKCPRFTNNDILNDKKNKSIEDIEKINLLGFFYNVISKYAKENYIYEINNSDNSGYYKIKYNNIGYEIGYMKSQKVIFFCSRIINIDNNFIDFNDILTNNKQPFTEEIDKILEELKIIITYYHEKGIPLMTLKKGINEVLNTLNNKKESKVLKKI